MPTYGDHDFAHLRQRFLHLVLTDVRDTRLPRRKNRVRTVRLRHRDERDLLPMSAPCNRGREPLAHLGDATDEVWKWHNMTFYRKLQSEASNAVESAADPWTARFASIGHPNRLVRYRPAGSSTAFAAHGPTNRRSTSAAVESTARSSMRGLSRLSVSSSRV